MIKITEKTQVRDYETRYSIVVEEDGKTLAGFSAGPLCECPEDATLERDLGYAYSAAEFFKLGYEAAKAGKEVEWVDLTLTEDEDL